MIAVLSVARFQHGKVWMICQSPRAGFPHGKPARAVGL